VAASIRRHDELAVVEYAITSIPAVRASALTNAVSFELGASPSTVTSVEKEIEEATTAYYHSLRGAELAEEKSLSEALSRAARRVLREAPASRRVCGYPPPRGMEA
jgi:hypothetical protein